MTRKDPGQPKTETETLRASFRKTAGILKRLDLSRPAAPEKAGQYAQRLNALWDQAATAESREMLATEGGALLDHFVKQIPAHAQDPVYSSAALTVISALYASVSSHDITRNTARVMSFVIGPPLSQDAMTSHITEETITGLKTAGLALRQAGDVITAPASNRDTARTLEHYARELETRRNFRQSLRTLRNILS